MTTFRTAAKIEPAGELHLDRIPFAEGDEVEVIVMQRSTAEQNLRYPLRGHPLRFDDPEEPVAEGDWEAR